MKQDDKFIKNLLIAKEIKKSFYYKLRHKKNNKPDEKIKDNIEPKEIEDNTIIQFPQPRGAQIEALYELNKARESGLDKALVCFLLF